MSLGQHPAFFVETLQRLARAVVDYFYRDTTLKKTLSFLRPNSVAISSAENCAGSGRFGMD
jgi:hypothetical protein